MAALENESEDNQEIHDQQLKIPQITHVETNSTALLVTFVFIKQAEKSIDNAKNSGHSHGGHAHKHGDEIVTIRKELQFHEIETQIQYSDNQNVFNISLGGFRQIELLQRCHSHEEEHKHCDSHENDSITLCYPEIEITEYLKRYQLHWTQIQQQQNYQIRMRLRYKIAYRVAHLSQQIDSVISCFSKAYRHQTQDTTEEKEKQHSIISCVSLCSNKIIQIDALSKSCKTRSYLTSKYPNKWLFHPSLCIANISPNILSTFEDINTHSSSAVTDVCSVLFCYDGFNKDEQTLSSCFALNLNDGIWYNLPEIKNKRSRSQLIYTPNTKQLLLCGGYQYDAQKGTKYMNSMQHLNLNEKQLKLEWIDALQMRANRCEHAIGVISKHNHMDNKDLVLICGGSNDMFLRSTSILSVNGSNTTDGSNVLFHYKRGGLMKEACIKGTMCHNNIYSNGDNVYIVGGNNGFGCTRNAQCFNILKNKWYTIHDTLYEHDDYPCVWCEEDNNSSFYGMMGVIGDSQQLSCVEYYDPRNNQWISHCQYPYFVPNAYGDDNIKLQIMRMLPWIHT